MDGSEQDVLLILQTIEGFINQRIEGLEIELERLFIILEFLALIRLVARSCTCARKRARVRSELQKFHVIQGGKD
jgi:hypothetical protein